MGRDLSRLGEEAIAVPVVVGMGLDKPQALREVILP
jgi:hypothetical protein